MHFNTVGLNLFLSVYILKLSQGGLLPRISGIWALLSVDADRL